MPCTCLRPTRSLALSLALLFTLAPAAAAQDEFDDEFGGEFGGDGADEGGAAGAEADTADDGAGADDPFADEFGEDADEPETFDDEFADDGAAGDDGAEAAAGDDPFADDPFGDPEDDGDAPGADEEPAADAAEVPEAIPAEVRAERARQLRVHNTLDGAVGGIRVADAGGGAAGSFRLQLALQYFSGGDFLVDGDENQRIGGWLSLSWTPEEFLELYASVYAGANSNPLEDPSLVQVIGDTTVGVKAFARVLPWLTVGGDFSVLFLNTVGDIGVVLDSTSFALRGNATADLRYLESEIPLVARLGLRYLFDRSERLISDVEQDRYAALADPPGAVPIENENRHLITPIERFALDINRTDFFDVELGFEVPITITDEWFLHPILEWQLRVPVNRQGYDCLDLRDPVTGDLPAGEDGCLDIEGFSAFPQILTIGLRVLPPVPGLSVLVGVDVGLTGTNDPVRELAATTPYNVLFGASYAYDATPLPPDPIVRVVERETEVPVEPPAGRVVGTVVTQGTGAPIEAAVVRFPGRDVTALSSSADGSFRSYEFDPGEVQVEVSHPTHEPGTCAATIPPEGGDAETRCELVAIPQAAALRVRVVGDQGQAVAGAQVALDGPSTKSGTTGSDGTVEIGDLEPGSYRAQVDAEDYLIRVVPSIEVTAGQTTQLEVTLLEKPEQASVVERRGSIALRRRINFATDSAEILPSSEGLLNEIADVLLRSPGIRRVEIQGHTDNRGDAEFNMRLSQRRAESVRDRLVSLGVDASRLNARGFGMTRPLVPNITASNRARNRRVQFIIRERADR